MADHSNLIAISAFSGLAGALLTQMMTGIFSYINDKRKYKVEVKNLYRSKKIEIGENFYYMNGETMTIIKKNIAYWKNKHSSRSELSLSFLSDEMKKLDAHMTRLKAENWKYNLIGLYFDVPFSFNEVMAANDRSHLLYLKVLDISEQIKKVTSEEERDRLYAQYNVAIFDLCGQYEDTYAKMETDMMIVKAALLKDFTTP